MGTWLDSAKRDRLRLRRLVPVAADVGLGGALALQLEEEAAAVEPRHVVPELAGLLAEDATVDHRPEHRRTFVEADRRDAEGAPVARLAVLGEQLREALLLVECAVREAGPEPRARAPP